MKEKAPKPEEEKFGSGRGSAAGPPDYNAYLMTSAMAFAT